MSSIWSQTKHALSDLQRSNFEIQTWTIDASGKWNSTSILPSLTCFYTHQGGQSYITRLCQRLPTDEEIPVGHYLTLKPAHWEIGAKGDMEATPSIVDVKTVMKAEHIHFLKAWSHYGHLTDMCCLHFMILVLSLSLAKPSMMSSSSEQTTSWPTWSRIWPGSCQGCC